MLTWLCVVFVFSTNDLLFLTLNSISPSALWSISKILCLGSMPLQRWQGVAWSLSSAPPANPVRAMGLCCLLRYLWPKERSPCTIKKVERSGLPKGEVSEFQCAHTKSYLQTWLWITEENAGVCRWIQTIFLPGRSIVLWAGHVSFTLAFTSSCHWISGAYSEMATPVTAQSLRSPQVPHQSPFTSRGIAFIWWIPVHITLRWHRHVWGKPGI